ncbi:BTB/POZ domain-containing protein KCTD3-like isoform X1 [Trichoplusia ni]|uniref:BTB/POZ domain-containing protein KCTD3-like isoform X1 n=1 Tax=Trichoplusia ni TaxID=7111 RepID=A0A7E5WRZ4_TRINI|nr:BTB/POZ domain-containing protein KCTD3-like isoform X1 [Trichoplusia ni]
MSNYQEIVNLNVGGTRFSTSWHTLTWVPETFFTALLSGRIPTVRDENGAIFIDRDPNLFGLILNFLRTRDIDLENVNIRALRHECDYFGITPLSRRLALCDEMNHSTCGDVLFYGYLPPPLNTALPNGSTARNGNSCSRKNSTASNTDVAANRTHSRNSSLDLRTVGRIPSQDQLSRCGRGHSRAASLGNADCHKGHRPPDMSSWSDSMKVQIIKAHHNWVAVAYTHFVTGYRLTDSCGWYVVFQSPVQDSVIERIALNAKTGGGGGTSSGNSTTGTDVMLGIASGAHVRLWAFSTHSEPVRRTLVGTFNLGVRVEHLLFVGPQLVALSGAGSRSKAGVWHTSTQHWQTQDVAHLTTYDTAGSFLLLGTATGAINYIDMQKFPLRMKDNDLLVTQLYKDPNQEPITAISVYLTPKTNLCGNWIEIAYGTRCGSVRVIVQHPETVGHGPQLFQTFTVHQSPITKVSLSENHLVSVCSEYNHVRTWRVTRFRGMISTQPGTTPKAAFKVLALEAPTAQPHNDCDIVSGPYGEQDEEQIFIQKVVPDTDTLYVRLASNGKRVCTIRSVDGSAVSCFVVAECEGALRPRRLLFCGHRSGATQMWDLTAPIDKAVKPPTVAGTAAVEVEESPVPDGGPSPDELVRLLSACDLDAAPAPPLPHSPNRPLQAP